MSKTRDNIGVNPNMTFEGEAVILFIHRARRYYELNKELVGMISVA